MLWIIELELTASTSTQHDTEILPFSIYKPIKRKQNS